jgi:tartrate-resistant acid phosphatase type 5
MSIRGYRASFIVTRILPSFSYTVSIKINNGEKELISLIMIDTVKMCGNSPLDSSTGPVYIDLHEQEQGREYFRAFEEKLQAIAQTRVPYILVAGHFPVWSIGDHGPTDCLVDRLRPLLHKYNVSAYFAGHDHNLQYIQETYLEQTVSYVVSGASSIIDGSTTNSYKLPADSLKFDWHDSFRLVYGGIVLAQASEENLNLQFYKSNGVLLFETSILPRFV